MPEPEEIGHQVRFGKGLSGLFKKACWVIPEIVGSSFMALLGVGFGIAGVYNYYKNDGDNREYKKVYMVVRDDDPRAKRLRKPTCTKFGGGDDE